MMTRKCVTNGVNSNGTEHIPLDAALDNDQPLLPRKKSLRQGLKEIYYEYCSNTSLHGVQYLGQRRPWKEIFMWLCVFVISLYLCTTTINKIYTKWMETPVIVSFSEHSTPISAIPFPAVTICSEIKRYGTDGPGYSELLEVIKNGSGLPRLPTSEQNEFLTLLHSCNYENLPAEIHRLSNSTFDFIRTLKEMSVHIEHQLLHCRWFGTQDSCEDIFAISYTEDGLCYTFNGFNGTDLYRENTVQYKVMASDKFPKASPSGRINRTLSWSLGKGYPKDTPLKTHPARVLSASTRASLDLSLIAYKKYLDYGCSGATQGFKIVVHTPDDVPLLSKRFMRVSLDKEVSIVVKPIMVTTSEGISAYTPEKRKCYLEGERQLKFFKVYSEKNCQMECLTNYTLEACKCVKYAMPRTPDMAVCREEKIHCYLQAEDAMLLENIVDGGGHNGGCNCMPSCTSLEYDVEISQADRDTNNYGEVRGELNFGDDVGWSRLNVLFKDNEFITSKRSELYGLSDFLANCGGILGLFMGFSILSVFELFYHFTLRLWSNLTRKNVVE